MEEKEPFKIKFTTVLIIVCMLLAIIGILAFNLRRLEDTLSTLTNNSTNTPGEPSGLAPLNDFKYYSENYSKALKKVLSNNEDSNEFGELSILKTAPDTNIGISSVTIDKLNDVYLNIPQNSPLYSKYGKITKIASNTMDVEFCHVGNGDLYELFFLNEDGTVSKLIDSTNRNDGITFSGDLSLKKVGGISDIIKIITIPVDNAEIAAFVDINGNVFTEDGNGIE